jgi:hypothetical protein
VPALDHIVLGAGEQWQTHKAHSLLSLAFPLSQMTNLSL